jgi:hypothetical protein
MIGKPFGAGEPRVEVFGIEVQVVDRMAAGSETLNDQPVKRGIETFLDGMGVEDKDFHAAAVMKLFPIP